MATTSQAPQNIKHINSVTHEGKVVVIATDADCTIWYQVKQDGFEDSALSDKSHQVEGWEDWQKLVLPNEEPGDASVMSKEIKLLLQSCYRTQDKTEIAPVQAISALGHVYIFRQSKANTLMVDRFVLDGMTNTLNPKLEVRFKRSKQKYQPLQNNMKRANGTTGNLLNVDSLDFRDANNNFFYEPTTELCVVNNLQAGWFSVVLVPTLESDVYRWHIFAYNSQTQKVELTTIRASSEGLFDIKDYTVFDAGNDTLVPRRIAGVIKRTLDVQGVTVTNGLAATLYNLQKEQQTQSGDLQLLKTATRLMLAIPTDQGTAAISFAIAGDGTLSNITDQSDQTPICQNQKEVLLPLDTLDEIIAYADSTPPPKGVISAIALGTNQENIEDLIKITTEQATSLANGDLVKITGTDSYAGLYSATKVDDDTFEIPYEVKGWTWEKEDPDGGGLVFDGMITGYQKMADGKLRITCPNHGVESGLQVQITGTDGCNDTYPVTKISDTCFAIDRKWFPGEAIDIRTIAQKRQGIVFDGVHDCVEIAHSPALDLTDHFTIEAWIKPDALGGRIIDKNFGGGKDSENNSGCFTLDSYQGLRFGNDGVTLQTTPEQLKLGIWQHVAVVFDFQAKIAKLFINGAEAVGGTPTQPGTSRPNLPIRIGAQADNLTGSCFKGEIAEVRIWNKARTAEELGNNMYLQLTGREVNLVGYWKLGAIFEHKTVDFSVNGNDGRVCGDPYVSAVTLKRKLKSSIDAVKYSNPELFAVSERATYEESFEFKVNATAAPNLAALSNIDGQGNPIFTLNYWGKASRSAEEIKSISTTTQNPFEDLKNGWYRVRCNVTIPDGVSMLRSFEIAGVNGDWESLEIRKQRICLVSDSVTQDKYNDPIPLKTLAKNNLDLETQLQTLDQKEQEEALLFLQETQLEEQIKLLEMPDDVARQQLTQDQQDCQNKVNNCQKQVDEWQKELNLANTDKVTLFIDQLDKGERREFGIGQYDQQWRRDISAARVPPTLKLKLYNQAGFQGDSWELCDTGNDFRKNNNWNDKIWSFRVETLVKGSKDLPALQLKLTNFQNDLAAAQSRLQEQKQKGENFETDVKNKQSKLEQLKTVSASVHQQLTTVQAEMDTLNTRFIEVVQNTSQTPQTMPQVFKDSRGLITQGALLGFVNSASRLNAIETCEGNVQLSYFDTQGRMRQTNYDATSDATSEQWISDAQRVCLNCSNSNSVIKLNQSLSLSSFTNWTIEAWFFYPLPETEKFNTLVRGQNQDRHICVENGSQLGIYLNDDPLGQHFYDCGFDLKSLPQGWHHLTAVGREDTTLFYIDGKPVSTLITIDKEEFSGTKAKALADAQDTLANTPDAAVAKQKVTDIKKAELVVSSDVYAVGNIKAESDSYRENARRFGEGLAMEMDLPNLMSPPEQFGKVAEVRIWGVALTEEEIAVNSKTLLTGKEPDLLVYYPCNEATGTTVRDQTGNGQNGTVTSASWWGCTAPIGSLGHPVMQFDGADDSVEIAHKSELDLIDHFTIEAWIKPDALGGRIVDKNIAGGNGCFTFDSYQGLRFGNQGVDLHTSPDKLQLGIWQHVAVAFDVQAKIAKLFINGAEADTGTPTQPGKSMPSLSIRIGAQADNPHGSLFKGAIAEVRIWNKARTAEEILADMNKSLSGKESNLVAYYPLNEIIQADSTQQVPDLSGNQKGTVTGATIVADQTFSISYDVLVSCESLVSCEYSTVSKDKSAMMRRLFAALTPQGVTLLPDKRIEALELKWIGNAQFAPTLLGYIEGAPPVPSENLTLSDDYNKATSVSLTTSEDVAYKWNRSQDVGGGAKLETFLGTDTQTFAGIGVATKIEQAKAGFKGDFDIKAQEKRESSSTSSSSLGMADKLELRGTPEQSICFPQLGKRFIPKNVGYALVVSALADVFVTRLARTGKMVGYQVQPIEEIPPDINTITFLINPAYTMNGSLDGLTGSSATSDRFFKQVPAMRAQYGALYPASYYRLQEAYALKQAIEAEDKRRESYFKNFDVLVDEDSLSRNVDGYNSYDLVWETPLPTTGKKLIAITQDNQHENVLSFRIFDNQGIPKNCQEAELGSDKIQKISDLKTLLKPYWNVPIQQVSEETMRRIKDDVISILDLSSPPPISVQREEDRPATNANGSTTNQQQAPSVDAQTQAASEKTTNITQAKQAQIQAKVDDENKRVHATESLANWQTKMEKIKDWAGKRNIVNTYVWDADGGLRSESQSFADTVEHSVGTSLEMNAELGYEGDITVSGVEGSLTAQATVNLTQTMTKTETSGYGLKLEVDLSGLESKGITDYKHNPILPGEKVYRYRFMSFYLEGSTNNFSDFFNYVVDPEWLASNDENARALRQAQAKPNKTWRVLHRVTYVERPALMGFGRDLRKVQATPQITDQQALLDKIAKLEEHNKKLESKLDQIVEKLNLPK